MKIKNHLINQFNTENTVIVVSTYPRAGRTYDPKALATAPFTKNKINAITKFANNQGQPVKFVVLADTIEGESAYVERKHLVIRCWTRNLLSVFATIQKYASLFPKAKTIVIEHEFGIFGLKHQITAQFPFFLALNRLLGKKVVLVLHQVIFDLGELSGHLQINPNSSLTKLLNLFIKVNYSLFGLLANHLVVFDASLKEKLSTMVNRKKISAIPLPNSGHTLSSHKNKTGIKKQLGLDPECFYIVFAGYVTWYKGADWLVKTFKRIKKQIKGRPVKLLLAGGQSSSLEIDTKYMNWYNKLLKNIATDKDIQITGVLPERMLPKYVAAADLIVMPYRLMMSASGPFTLAQTAGTPVIVSTKLRPMTNSEDLYRALKKNGLSANDFVFPLTPAGLKKKLSRANTDPTYLKQLTNTIRDISPLRSCESQAEAYAKIFSAKQAPNTVTLTDSQVVPAFARLK